MKPLPLRTSLTFVYTGMLALLLCGLAVVYHRILVAQLDADTTAVLEDVARGLHGYLQFRDGRPSLAYRTDDPEAVTFVEEATRYYQIYDAGTGRLLVQSPALASLGLHYTPAEVADFRRATGIHDVETDLGRIRIHSSLVAPGTGGSYLLQVGESLDRFERATGRLERLLFWWLGTGLVAAGLVGYWMAGRALRPLARLATSARNVDITNLHARLPIRGANDALDDVATAFNHALSRVEDGVGQMRQFSAALAHELRTPLAILRGETELALAQPALPAGVRRQLEQQLDEFDRLSRLITQILTLARAEAGEIPLARDGVDVGAVAVEVCEQMEPVAAAKGVRLTVSVPGAALAIGDRGWIARVLLILLDNAITFTPGGGRVHAAVARADGAAVLTVTDTGIGIAADALPRVFERFYQADPARGRRDDRGAGLGLALARWIVGQHGGTIAAASRVGEGSTFTVRWPPAVPAEIETTGSPAA